MVAVPDLVRDAQREFRTLQDGAVVIVPTAIGYAIVGACYDLICDVLKRHFGVRLAVAG